MHKKTMVQVLYRRQGSRPTLVTRYVQAVTNSHAWETVKSDYADVEILDVYVTSNTDKFQEVTA